MTQDILTTRRLVLRPLVRQDAPAIEALGNRDFEVVRWLTGPSWPYEEGEASAFVENAMKGDALLDEAVWAITLGGVMIGCVSIQAPGDLEELPGCPTLGYWLGSAFQGFGYATEAAGAAVGWAFQAHECAALGARVYEDNSGSRNVLRKLGFKPWDMTVRYARPIDRKVSCVVLRLARADFRFDKVAA